MLAATIFVFRAKLVLADTTVYSHRSRDPGHFLQALMHKSCPAFNQWPPDTHINLSKSDIWDEIAGINIWD
jgi:hypothetical protein